jgi:NAD(P)-dependent dehydrogenase (short-subunit alcohol dehydrogenase family)
MSRVAEVEWFVFPLDEMFPKGIGVAPCYVFLARDDSSYMTGQVLHPNEGKIVNG